MPKYLIPPPLFFSMGTRQRDLVVVTSRMQIDHLSHFCLNHFAKKTSVTLAAEPSCYHMGGNVNKLILYKPAFICTSPNNKPLVLQYCSKYCLWTPQTPLNSQNLNKSPQLPQESCLIWTLHYSWTLLLVGNHVLLRDGYMAKNANELKIAYFMPWCFSYKTYCNGVPP